MYCKSSWCNVLKSNIAPFATPPAGVNETIDTFRVDDIFAGNKMAKGRVGGRVPVPGSSIKRAHISV